MKAVPALTLIAPLALMLGGCDWIAGAGSSSDTKMTNVEILPGTASDEMITLDQASGDGTHATQCRDHHRQVGAARHGLEVRVGQLDRPAVQQCLPAAAADRVLGQALVGNAVGAAAMGAGDLPALGANGIGRHLVPGGTVRADDHDGF